MVAIGYFSVALLGLAGLATASPSEGDMVNMESRYVKATFGGPGAAPKWRVRDEAGSSLTKRMSCASGNCKIPSTFGKHKMAGAVARYEDALYERDVEHLIKRISCASGNCKIPSTFGGHKMAGAIKMRAEDYLYEREDKFDGHLTKRISCASGNYKFPSTFGKHKMASAVARDKDALFERDESEGRNPVAWAA